MLDGQQQDTLKKLTDDVFLARGVATKAAIKNKPSKASSSSKQSGESQVSAASEAKKTQLWAWSNSSCNNFAKGPVNYKAWCFPGCYIPPLIVSSGTVWPTCDYLEKCPTKITSFFFHSDCLKYAIAFAVAAPSLYPARIQVLVSISQFSFGSHETKGFVKGLKKRFNISSGGVPCTLVRNSLPRLMMYMNMTYAYEDYVLCLPLCGICQWVAFFSFSLVFCFSFSLPFLLSLSPFLLPFPIILVRLLLRSPRLGLFPF